MQAVHVRSQISTHPDMILDVVRTQSNNKQTLLLCAALAPGVQRGLEEMAAELSTLNPSFTIRRQFVQAQEEGAMIDNLRRVGDPGWQLHVRFLNTTVLICICITHSVIKGQLLSYHVYVVWEVKNPVGW